MNCRTNGPWLFVWFPKRDGGLDWDRMMAWKIPEGERIHVPSESLWILPSKHSELVKSLASVYHAVSGSNSLEGLQTAQRLISKIEREETDRPDVAGENGPFGYRIISN